ncbi:MAG: hypothetical protein ACWGSQ_10940 [Longimicrobiales bacterium]
MSARVHFEQRSGWPWWAHLAFSVTFLAAALPLLELAQGKTWGQGDAMPIWAVILCLVLGIGLPVTIYFFLGQLRVRVLDDGVEAAWGISEVIRKTIPFREIRKAESVTYSPLSEFGGWGIRAGFGGKRAWTVRGKRAVRLHLRDGTLFYLGSQRPERLLGWIQSVGKGKMADSSGETSEADGGPRESPGRLTPAG